MNKKIKIPKDKLICNINIDLAEMKNTLRHDIPLMVFKNGSKDILQKVENLNDIALLPAFISEIRFRFQRYLTFEPFHVGKVTFPVIWKLADMHYDIAGYAILADYITKFSNIQKAFEIILDIDEFNCDLPLPAHHGRIYTFYIDHNGNIHGASCSVGLNFNINQDLYEIILDDNGLQLTLPHKI